MEKLRADAYLFLFGALGYPFIEILWRGSTHPTMALAGGLGAVALFRLNRGLSRGALPLRLLASGAAVTLIELLFGVIFNLGFGMEVWDYSEMPLHLFGQICLPYSLLWCLLSLPFCLFCARVGERRSAS
ncbi:MAG: hypothetical protein J6Z04_07250 [Clostridia bacterium]|nr:hypothetical protein [Clostridia bacterium]